MLRDARSSNDDHAFRGVLKDWAWKFKRKVRLKVTGGPITRSRAKKFKAALNGFIQATWAQEQGIFKPIEEQKRGDQVGGWFTIIQAHN